MNDIRRLDQALGRMREGVVVLSDDLRYTYVSARAEEILGRRKAELLGSRLGELEAEAMGARPRKEIEAAMVTQRFRTFEHHCSGEWLEFRVYPDEEGLTLSVVEVTRRKEEEQKREQILRTLQKEYNAVLEHSQDAVILVDVEGGKPDPDFYYERLRIFPDVPSGVIPEDVRGKSPREVFGEELGAEIEANYRRCVETEAPVSYEEELSVPEGRIVWQTRLAPVILEDEIPRLVGIARDITERVGWEQELQRKNEQLGEFAGVVSHDLRNPLNIALGHTTLAQEELAREGYESTHLEKVEEALGRMQAIITDTLILARRGERVSETEPISMPDLLQQCWDMVDPEGVTLEVEDAFTVHGDRNRLRHIFENLFRNAVQHGDEVGTVWVGQTDEVMVYVEDDGVGISEGDREEIFEAGTTTSSEGTGFGLTIVKRVAEAHGWHVRVTDGREGGARFEFSEFPA